MGRKTDGKGTGGWTKGGTDGGLRCGWIESGSRRLPDSTSRGVEIADSTTPTSRGVDFSILNIFATSTPKSERLER